MNQEKKKGIVAELSLLLRSIPSLTVTIFVVATISMNLLANKSIELPFSWLALDCGIIVSWIIFLCMDIVTRRFGPRAATLLSAISILVNLGMCLIFFLGSLIPGMWGEAYVEGEEALLNGALNRTFGGTWYVLLGSSIAFFVAAVVNNFLNWYIGKVMKKDNGFFTYACRTYISTAIGQFVDNFTFALIVSHNFFGWTMLQCVMCAFTGAMVELLCEIIFSPIGYRVSNRWKKQKIGEEYLEQFPYNR